MASALCHEPMPAGPAGRPLRGREASARLKLSYTVKVGPVGLVLRAPMRSGPWPSQDDEHRCEPIGSHRSTATRIPWSGRPAAAAAAGSAGPAAPAGPANPIRGREERATGGGEECATAVQLAMLSPLWGRPRASRCCRFSDRARRHPD